MSTNPPADSRIKAALVAQNRDRRAKARALKRRRDDLLDDLARTIPRPLLTADLLTGEDAFNLVAGHLLIAKSVARRVARRALLQSGRPLNGAPPIVRRDIPRPTRIVAEAHRPDILPGLVAEVPAENQLSVEQAVMVATQQITAGKTHFAILDDVKATTGVSWETSAAMLFHAGIFRARLSPDSIAMAAEAREFWHQWDVCRNSYHAALHLGQIQAAEGEWGLLEAPQVAAMLPGFSLPKSALRNEFLVRLIRKPPSSLIDLDFHAATHRPLFRVLL